MRRMLVVGAVLASACLWSTLIWATEDSFFESDGVRIHYIVDGGGEPVLLIHGFTASVQMNWVGPGIYKKLAEHYKVIALDLRGHGSSGKPHGVENYGTQMTKDVLNLLDHLGIEKVHVVGYSMGGVVTLYLIATNPERFDSAVLGGAGWRRPGDSFEGTSEIIANALESGEGVAPLVKLLTPAGQEPPSAEQIEAMNRIVLATNDPIALASVIRSTESLIVSEEKLSSNQVPMTAVVGELDPAKSTVDSLRDAKPSVEVVVVPGASHTSTVTSPEFIAAIMAHLAEYAQVAHPAH